MNGEPLPPWLTPAIIGGVLTLTVLGERVAPLRRIVESKIRHLARNFTAAGVSLAFMTLLQTPVVVPFSRLVADDDWGILGLFEAPHALEIAIAVLLLDYTLWWWHWANHRVPFLWRFHLVHHVDRDLDASTALRFHFGELLLSIPVRLLQIAIIGAGPASVAVWQAILFASILFHHSNIRLPRALEGVVVRFIVTPRMHGIHHSIREDETNSNWSSMFTAWDFLHRTFRFDVPDETIVIGVPAYQQPEDVTIGKILTMPFRRQRQDWHGDKLP